MIGQHAPTNQATQFADNLVRVASRVARVERAIAAGEQWTEVTTSPTMGTAWSLVSFQAARSRRLLQFLLVVERTTSTLVVTNGTGDVTNETVATLPTECRGGVTYGVPITSGSTGRGVFGTYIPVSGLVRINAFAGDDDVTAGTQLSLGGCVYINA